VGGSNFSETNRPGFLALVLDRAVFTLYLDDHFDLPLG
jgi:hypothetical protein